MISTNIRFNSHNSYNITTPLLSFPFNVSGFEYITHSFQAFALTPLPAEIRAKTKFFDEDGVFISEINHTFPVSAVFDKVEITVEVPLTAFQAQLIFLKGTTSWWLAEPKSESGTVATPFNMNITTQLTFITSSGIYTGMVNANQIVVSGTIENPDETLEKRLVTINQNSINVSANVSTLDGKVSGHSTRITTIEAGQITLTNTVNSKVGIGVDYKGVTIDATNGFTSTATVGGKTIVTKANSMDGLSIYNGSTKVFGVDTSGRVFTQSISNLEDSSWYATMGVIDTDEQGLVLYSSTTPKYLQITESNGGVLFLDRNLKIRITIGTTATVLHDISGANRFYADNGLTILKDGNNARRFYADNGLTILKDSSDTNRFYADSNLTQLDSPTGGAMAIGVDANGPYYVKNSSKTYF